MHTYGPYACRELGDQKKVSETGDTVRGAMWLHGAQPGSSRRTTSALNH